MGVSRKLSLLFGVVGLSVLLASPAVHAETSYHSRPFRTAGHKCAHNELANKANPWDDRECIPVCDWGSGFNTLIGKCEKCECGSAWGAFPKGERILNEDIEGINGYGAPYSAYGGYGQHSYDNREKAADPDCSCICGPSATFIAGEGCVRWDIGREKYGTHRGFSRYSNGRGDRSTSGSGHKKGRHGHRGRRNHYDNKRIDKSKHGYRVGDRRGGNDWEKSEDYSNWSSDDYPVSPRQGGKHSSLLWNNRPEKSFYGYGRRNRWGAEDESRQDHSFDYRGKRGKHDVDRKGRGYGKHFGRWDGNDSKDEKWSESDSWSRDGHDRRHKLRRGRRGQNKDSWEESKESWDRSKDGRRGRRRRNAGKDSRNWAESNDFFVPRKGDRNDQWQSKNGGNSLENGEKNDHQFEPDSRDEAGKWGDDDDDDNKWDHDDDDDGKNKQRRGRRGDGGSKDDDNDHDKWGKDDDDKWSRGRKGRFERGSGDDDDKWGKDDDDRWGRGRKGRFDRGSGDNDDKWVKDDDNRWGRDRKGRFDRGSGDDDDKWNDNDDKSIHWKDRRTRDRFNGESRDNDDEKWGNGDDGKRGDRKRRGRDRGSRDNDDEKWDNGVVKGTRPRQDNKGGSWDKGSEPRRPVRQIPNSKDDDDKWNGGKQSRGLPAKSKEENIEISKDNGWGKGGVKNTVPPSI